MSLNLKVLHKSLKLIQRETSLTQELGNDPLKFSHRFQNSSDQEVIAFITVLFAYGNVKQILKTNEKILTFLGPNPYKKLKATRDWNIPQTFCHRFNTADDVSNLFSALGKVLRAHGSLENSFMKFWNGNIVETLDLFIENIIMNLSKDPTPGLKFLLSRPNRGGANKRLFLFLRWMIRSEFPDLGLWKNLSPSQLLIPVDTHILRISKNLGLTSRKTADLKTAMEITENLKQLSPEDPVQFDFSLCHLGISKLCPSRLKISICKECKINHLCLNYSNS